MWMQLGFFYKQILCLTGIHWFLYLECNVTNHMNTIFITTEHNNDCYFYQHYMFRPLLWSIIRHTYTIKNRRYLCKRVL